MSNSTSTTLSQFCNVIQQIHYSRCYNNRKYLFQFYFKNDSGYEVSIYSDTVDSPRETSMCYPVSHSLYHPCTTFWIETINRQIICWLQSCRVRVTRYLWCSMGQWHWLGVSWSISYGFWIVHRLRNWWHHYQFKSL